MGMAKSTKDRQKEKEKDRKIRSGEVQALPYGNLFLCLCRRFAGDPTDLYSGGVCYAR